MGGNIIIIIINNIALHHHHHHHILILMCDCDMLHIKRSTYLCLSVPGTLVHPLVPGTENSFLEIVFQSLRGQ